MADMLNKLQRKTLMPAQLAGYLLTLLTGAAIVILSAQLFCDLSPLLSRQTDVFRAHTVTVSKNVTLFKTANKEGIYFTDKELDRLKSQEFVKEVATFGTATFSASAAISFGAQRMSTELFFESVPDNYLDVSSDDWKWDSASGFVPVVIPEDYLQLYNFGFAESQSLPVVSEGVLSQVTFDIIVEGNGKRQVFDGRIVGLSGKINSILVPEQFLAWANARFGSSPSKRSSRLLVEFDDASDERIPSFFEANGLNISKNELETSKMAFFFRLAMLFVFFIALIIFVLSLALIITSMNLIVQKNHSLFVNLYNVGYSVPRIASYYRALLSVVSVAVLAVSLVVVMLIRGVYLRRLSTVFTVDGTLWPSLVCCAILTAVVLLVCNVLTTRIVRETVR